MAADDVARQLLNQHPLQRWPSPSRGLSAFLHSLALASFIYSFDYLVRYPNPINDSYGWHLQFLTIIGLALATATVTIGLLADLTLSRTLFAVKNILSVASAPLACLISLLYWGLRAIDHSLVLPDWAPPISLHSDLSFHAVPAFSLIVDLLFLSPPYTIAFLPALGLSATIAFGYWWWVEQCYRVNHFYPYPLFEILSTPQRVGLFAFAALLMTISTVTLRWMYAQVNGQEMKIGLHSKSNGSTRKPKEQSGNVNGK
ncbi:hypothetical protein B0A50_05658 [Salinomyces thailandicus]|uniref:FAR-17a/AIG1-like protein n=1 Tax=Salinomyces thailandicus TaxID=706561 RepID=A0A4U0TU99_9PEZI|nr:hypothetical protein B0A50_05658 [Salinomyces thailandica]